MEDETGIAPIKYNTLIRGDIFNRKLIIINAIEHGLFIKAKNSIDETIEYIKDNYE